MYVSFDFAQNRITLMAKVQFQFVRKATMLYRRLVWTVSIISITGFLVVACQLLTGSDASTDTADIDAEASAGGEEAEEGFNAGQFDELEDNEKLDAPDFGSVEADCAIGPDEEGCQQVSVDEVSSPDGGVSGPIIRLSVTNTGSEEVIVTIPCGLVFQPGNDGEQRMIVVQPATVAITAFRTVKLTPYVMCIDSDKDPAGIGASYSVGTLAREDLLALAACICELDLSEELDENVGDFGLQLAVWSLADGRSLNEVEAELADSLEELAEFFPEGTDLDSIQSLEDLQELEGMEDFQDVPGYEDLQTGLLHVLMTSVDDVSLWYEECDIEPPL